jgi:predicted heme/steroid binding protein/uncharacterized membrane protein
MNRFKPEDLAQNNGKDGKPTYVAVNGKVYDLSQSAKWMEGAHMKRHQAGRDLSSDLSAAPHGPEVLDRFPLVGHCETPTESEYSGTRARIEEFLDAHPFFRRHPHPALVHFPVALFMVAAVFEIFALALGSTRTEWAALLCVLVGFISMPPVIATGYFTWWINYDCGKSRIIKLKRILGWLTLLVVIAALALRYFMVNPLDIDDPMVLAYAGTLIILGAISSIVGYLGGKLSFPY